MLKYTFVALALFYFCQAASASSWSRSDKLPSSVEKIMRTNPSKTEGWNLAGCSQNRMTEEASMQQDGNNAEPSYSQDHEEATPWSYKNEKCPYRQFYGQCLVNGFGKPEPKWEESFIGWDNLGEVQAACASTLRQLGQHPGRADELLSAYGNHAIGQTLLISDKRYRKGAVRHLLNMAWKDEERKKYSYMRD